MRLASAAAVVIVVASACGDDPSIELDASPSADGSVSDSGVAYVIRVVESERGLPVTLIGPRDAVTGVPDIVGAAALCEEFELSVSLQFAAGNHDVVRFGGTATYAAAPSPCEGAGIFCVPEEHFRRWVAPEFTFYEEPPPVGMGFYNHPIGVSFYPTDLQVETWYMGVYSSRTLWPITGFSYPTSGLSAYFPRGWQVPNPGDSYAGSEVWVRVIEEPFIECAPSEWLVPDALGFPFMADLAECGIVFAMTYPIHPGDQTFGDAPWCPTEDVALGLTLTSSVEHPKFSTECPRPMDASNEYRCYSTDGSATSAK